MAEASLIYAIVPAAGQSRRMGRAKQLIPIDGRPMLRTVVETIAASDVSGVMIVTRREILEALGSLQIDKVHAAYNEDENSEMIDSIRIGIRAWQERQSIQSDAGFLLCPADHPGLSVQDISTCTHAFRNSPTSIIIASFAGRRGHPLIFPADLADFVLSPACDNGLNALPHAMPERIKLVPCNSIGVLKDIDTPEDLSSL